jgi:hypothetical protein
MLPGALAVATRLLERVWIASIAGESVSEPGRTTSADFLTGRLDGAWHVLFQGRFSEGPAWFAPAALVLAGAAGVALRGRRPMHAVTLAGAAGALLLARAVIQPDDPVTGLLAAWPLVVLGLVALPAPPGRESVALLLSVAAFVGAVLVTQYPEGGGLEWGGRFLSPVIVPLAALVAVGLRSHATAMGRPAMVAGVVVTVAAALAAAVVTAGLRADHDRAIASVERHRRPVAVTTLSALPRLAWRTDDTIDWLLATRATLEPLAERASSRGPVLIAVGRTGPAPPPDRFRPVPTHERDSDLVRLFRFELFR